MRFRVLERKKLKNLGFIYFFLISIQGAFHAFSLLLPNTLKTPKRHVYCNVVSLPHKGRFAFIFACLYLCEKHWKIRVFFCSVFFFFSPYREPFMHFSVLVPELKTLNIFFLFFILVMSFCLFLKSTFQSYGAFHAFQCSYT